MTSPSWDADQYLTFAEFRARPFADLVARVTTADPAYVVDLGCGPGNVTRTLAAHWPNAHVVGVDSSPAMIEAAGQWADDRLTFTLDDISTWAPDRPVDVIIANASLQWVPDHVALMPAWIDTLRPGGTLAFQIPANPDGPAITAFRAVAGSPRWSGSFAHLAATGALERHILVPTMAGYADALGRLGCAVDAWETTYLHLLPGADPVLEWYAGTGLRPYTDALDGVDLLEFRADVAAALREAYPRRPDGTPLAFRRVFVVARR